VQLVSKISNLCDPADHERHAIARPRFALVHRAAKMVINSHTLVSVLVQDQKSAIFSTKFEPKMSTMRTRPQSLRSHLDVDIRQTKKSERLLALYSRNLTVVMLLDTSQI